LLAVNEGTAAVPLCCLIEQTQPCVSIAFALHLAGRNHANRIACREPLDFIAGMDVILFRDNTGNRDLILGCDFGHRVVPAILTIARIVSLS